jgi:hypothetical protein
VAGGTVEGMTSRRPVAAGFRDSGVAGPDAASTVRRRPMMVGSVVAPAAVPLGRRASSDPLAVRGVPAVAEDAALVRRPAVTPLGVPAEAGDDAAVVRRPAEGDPCVEAWALPVPRARRRAVTAPWFRPYRSFCDLKAYEPQAPLRE